MRLQKTSNTEHRTSNCELKGHAQMLCSLRRWTFSSKFAKVKPMRFRTYKNTSLTVSEVGFGLWTISTGWWGNFTEVEAIALMHKAFDFGITCNRPFCERGRA